MNTVINVLMCVWVYAFLCLGVFLVSSPLYHCTWLPVPPGASCHPLCFSNNIIGYSTRHTLQQDVWSSRLWNSQILKGFWLLLPTPLDTAFAFTLRPVNHGLRSLPHLLKIVSALSKWWQVGVEELSGPAILRKEGANWRNTITASICTKKNESLLESQITFAKVMRQNKSCLISSCSNVFLMYLTLLFAQQLRNDSDYIFSVRKLGKMWYLWSSIQNESSKNTHSYKTKITQA